MGLKEIIALTINGIIGAGIFAMPATISGILGPASPIAFIGAGLFAAIIVLCFAELGGLYDRTGGAYLYASEAFGGSFAFLVGWMYFLARITSVAALSNALAGFVGYFFELHTPIRELMLVGIISALGLINYIGIRSSSRIINFLTIVKLAPLLTFIFIGLAAMNLEVFSGVPFPEFKPLQQALLLCMFAFTGFEVVAIPGAEIVNPRKNLPLGMLAGTGITILIYLSIQIVAVSTYPGIASSTRPLAEAAETFLGRNGGLFLTVGAICSTIGTLMGLILVSPRIVFAMGLNHQFPKTFTFVHPRFRTPSRAIILFTSICILVTLSSSFANLATLSAMARMVTYIGSALALLILRKKYPSPDTFRTPGGPIIPILTVVLSLVLLTAATKQQWITGLAALGVGVVLYYASRKKQD